MHVHTTTQKQKKKAL